MSRPADATKHQPEEILNTIFRPGEWMEDSLLKYERPLRVKIKTTDNKSAKGRPLRVSPQPGVLTGPVPRLPPPKPKSRPTDATKHQPEEILNTIFPPREWTKDNQLWVQFASSSPSSLKDVVHLTELLALKLQGRRARESALCPVRREDYFQCFDELIRQVTINCAERGLLLHKVRDESRMTIATYETLYESSKAYGDRKGLQSEQDKSDMEKRISDLEDKNRALERQLNEQNYDETEEERRGAEEKKRQEKVEKLKNTLIELKDKLQDQLSK